MTPVRKKRMYAILVLVCGAGVATALALAALRHNIDLFYTPSQIATGQAPYGIRIRAGGLVESGSLQRTRNSLALRFTVTDGARSIVVRYEGILPDLFREGQGIVATGTLENDGMLHADQVLAKHDENYMPPEAMHALKSASATGDPPYGNKEQPR